jgi:hypothetical protein
MKMKVALLVLMLLITVPVIVSAQVNNNLVVFCNEPEPFTLILNGQKQNQEPQTSVWIGGLDLKVYEVKVIFVNTKLKDVNTTLTFYRTGKECVFALNKKGKKTHTLDYLSEKNIDSPVIKDPPVTTNTLNPNMQTTVTNTTNPGSNTPVNTVTSFQTLLDAILAQPTEQGKLNVALAALANKTFSIAEVKQILMLFSSEQTRLNFAKQVYAKIKDPSFYVGIVDTFVNEGIKIEFKKFTEGK